MAKSGSRGVVLLIVAMLVAALAYRFWPRGSSSEVVDAGAVDAAVASVDSATRTADAATVVIADAEVEDDRPVYPPPLDSEGFDIAAISNAGDKVLLHRRTREPGDIPAYKVLDIATGDAVAEVEMPAWKFLGIDSDEKPATDEERRRDVEKVLPLLAGFPLGAGGEIAASPDGKSGAFNDGDPLYVLHKNRVTKLPFPAAYDPHILADGKTLMFRGYDGEFDGPGTGRYSLFWVSLDGGKPQKIASTEGSAHWALSFDGRTLRTFATDGKYVPTCLIEIPLVKPFKISRKRCIDAVDATVGLSRGGDHVGWLSVGQPEAPATLGKKRDLTMRLRLLEIERGSVPIDHVTNGWFLVGDRGRVLLEADGKFFDLRGTSVRAIESPGYSITHCRFYSDSAIVCPSGGSITRFELD